ncbi:MAG: SDR family oxidoreductase [Candidatus Omnitrophica bacterium]|nr:SDR family oxidoreductase [Candidatus Omnitrophota bacterium]
MEKSKIRIAITGATGLLGRNLLFEYIKQQVSNLDGIEIFVLGRGKDDLEIKGRFEDILLTDGLLYIYGDRSQTDRIRDYNESRIKYINMDLSIDGLGISQEDYDQLAAKPINIFFHVAAMTDFRNTPEVAFALKRINVEGTLQILKLISAIRVKEFVYVGTAYSCGMAAGKILPNDVNLKQEFRNPYEFSKTEAEMAVREFAKKNKQIRFRYFRPSTISGRLMEQPLGAINKFDVFYSWAGFFLRIKTKEIKDWGKKYSEPFRADMRIFYSMKSGLNIVPADYAAKVMYQVCTQNIEGSSYHLVNDEETPHKLYIPIILDAINFNGVTQVNAIPDRMNRLEQLYYKTVGWVFTPYIISDPMLFCTKSIEKAVKKSGIVCPTVDFDNFSILIRYAKEYDFGLVEKRNLQLGVSSSVR